MNKSTGTRLAVLLVLCLGLVVVVGPFIGAHRPVLTVSLVTCSNDSGGWIASFAITNTGAATAISSGLGEIEIFGRPQPSPIGYRAAVHRLSPGKGEVVDVLLPQRIDGRWRFTFLYARSSLRTTLYDWQLRNTGLARPANRLVPRFLKRFPLDVKGTSGWIEELQFRPTGPRDVDNGH